MKPSKPSTPFHDEPIHNPAPPEPVPNIARKEEVAMPDPRKEPANVTLLEALRITLLQYGVDPLTPVKLPPAPVAREVTDGLRAANGADTLANVRAFRHGIAGTKQWTRLEDQVESDARAEMVRKNARPDDDPDLLEVLHRQMITSDNNPADWRGRSLQQWYEVQSKLLPSG